MRISKADVKALLAEKADNLLKASSDPFVSRDDAKKAADAEPTKLDAALSRMFYGFIDHRDFKAGARVTGADVSRAVEYAAAHMVDRLDTNKNGLSKAEIAKGSNTVQIAAAIIMARRDAAKVSSAD